MPVSRGGCTLAVQSHPVDRWIRNVGRFVGDEIEQIVVTSTDEVEVTVIDLSTYDSVSFECNGVTPPHEPARPTTGVSIWAQATNGGDAEVSYTVQAKGRLCRYNTFDQALAGLAIPETIRRAIETAW